MRPRRVSARFGLGSEFLTQQAAAKLLANLEYELRFLGIQFGWGLQMANMSAIYEYLGAKADQIPIPGSPHRLQGWMISPVSGAASQRIGI